MTHFPNKLSRQAWGRGKRRNSKGKWQGPQATSSMILYPNYEALPDHIKYWFGYRLSLNTIANADWLERKKKLWNPRLDTKTNSANMRQFMQDARNKGVYRNYTGLVTDFSEIDTRIFVTIQLDESCRSPEDRATIFPALKDGRWDNWHRMPPRQEDLMEMMTSSNGLLREFAIKFYKENDEAAGTVLELLTKMDPEARLNIFEQFCRNCGKTKCNCG